MIASNIEGFAAVVTHGVEGLLVEPKNESALALALVHLLADSDLRAEMAARACVRAEEYSWARVAQRVLSYYERLLYERSLSGECRGRRDGRGSKAGEPGEVPPLMLV